MSLEELSADECLRLLEQESFVGRVGFIVDGQPMILPVNYLAEKGSVVFCTAPGRLLAVLEDGVPVVFEVDASRPLYNSGWSVVVRGTARQVTDENERELLRRGPLKSWSEPPEELWVRISIDEISGRRIPES